jgi:hypothetical protein
MKEVPNFSLDGNWGHVGGGGTLSAINEEQRICGARVLRYETRKASTKTRQHKVKTGQCIPSQSKTRQHQAKATHHQNKITPSQDKTTPKQHNTRSTQEDTHQVKTRQDNSKTRHRDEPRREKVDFLLLDNKGEHQKKEKQNTKKKAKISGTEV